MTGSGEDWQWISRPGALLLAKKFDVRYIAVLLCYRDWHERLEDAAIEFAMTQSALTRLCNNFAWDNHSPLYKKAKYPFNTKNLTDDDILSLRNIGMRNVKVIRRADRYPPEPMSCLSDEEREHIKKHDPYFSFDAVEINAKLLMASERSD